jgi:hypothetical protein
VLIWEGHPWHSKNRSKIMLSVLYSYFVRGIGPPSLFLDRLSTEQLPSSFGMHSMKLLLKMYNKLAKFLQFRSWLSLCGFVGGQGCLHIGSRGLRCLKETHGLQDEE